ncbi:MAG: Asp-tRNA(Asn)/Glu-tRNA(Gln) amidotransferase subunit GatA [Actinobacteria bacterium]|nr:Asp-tRNA(Asn)/Glu-tRNA(Gln) amidotransferase subunit GatA [Actinomycetota bacterium]
MSELWTRSAWELASSIASREVTATEVTTSVLQRLESQEPTISAFVTKTADQALAKAAKVDSAIAAGVEVGPVAGVPMALKDIICTKGVRSTASSKILENYIPPYSATVAERLDRAGLPLVGKTNLDEFAMGSSTENSAFFTTKNPWDPAKVPGGSSGGSAASVAAGQAVWSLGTDTGGSIRQPAALCGVVGVKPTYGLVSRYGLIAFASSLDQAGPFTRNVRDAALMLKAIAGKDPRDSTSLPDEVPDYVSVLDRGISGMKIGIVSEISGAGMQPGVKSRFDDAVRVLEKLGAEVGEISLPTFEYGIDVYYLIAPAEASANLARYDGVRYGLRVDGDDIVQMNSRTRSAGFGPEVKRRIMLGTYSLSAGYYDAYYGKALKAMYLSDVCNVPTSLAGAAAISVPCGLADEDNMPVGLQIMARPLDEVRMFQAAYAFEQELGFITRPPSWGDS